MECDDQNDEMQEEYVGQNDVLQEREGRRLLFAFLATAPSICPPSELTMFAVGQERRKRYCNPSNLFISSGTRWSRQPFIFLPLPGKWRWARDGWGHCRDQLFGGGEEHIQSMMC